jgi:hypothetical protein
VVGQNNSTKNEIKNLILVIFSGVAGACLLALAMLHYYGPSGRYTVRNVLLSPVLIQNLSYQDVSPKTGKLALYTFDGIDFSHYDNDQKKWMSIPISKERYAIFFELIAQELSLEETANQVQDSFYKGKSSKLLIKIKTESNEQKTFQEIDLAPLGDFYRIQLRVQAGSGVGWAYFYHPGIYQEAMKLFLLKP